MKGEENLSIQSGKGLKRADKRLLWGKKSHENFLLLWFFHIKKTLHLIKHLKGMQRSKPFGSLWHTLA